MWFNKCAKVTDGAITLAQNEKEVFTMKKERHMKVYGYEDRWHDKYPAEIRLKGKWLKELGFTVNTPITVFCEEGKLVIVKR